VEPFDLVISKLDGAKVNGRGNQAMARCPGHPDRSPSLSVTKVEDGKVLLKCFAFCETEKVVAALGLSMTDLFPANGHGHSRGNGDRPKVVARYTYTDEHGEILYKVERYEPGFDGARKSFAQRPASGKTGKGAMDGVRLVLYGLPDVLKAAANHETIWIAEGEKDVDRLILEGVTATCAPGGAGKWAKVADAVSALSDAGRIVIVADNDEPGYKHAAEIRASLADTVADVTIVRAASGKDAFDHFAAGWTIQDFVSVDYNGPDNVEDELHLPDAFYESRPELDHISKAARSRLISRDALLGVILARVAAIASHTLELPGIVGAPVGLTFYIATAGPAGASKTATSAVGRGLVPNTNMRTADMLPIGSGEGLIEALFDLVEEEDEHGKTKRTKIQTRYGAIVYVDEGAILGELGQRRGSTLLPIIRSAYTHGVIGQTNASIERRRILEGTNYVYGLIMGIQPQLAGPILDDAPAGTPQRFVWFSATDPNMTDEDVDWPGELRWKPPSAATLDHHQTRSTAGYVRHQFTVADSIRNEIRADRLAVMRGADRAPMEAHSMLVRLKTAALLAVLNERLDVRDDDWELAGQIITVSRAVRTDIDNTLKRAASDAEQAATERHVRRELTVDNNREASALRSAARSVANVVRRHRVQQLHDGCTRRCLTQAVASKHRALVSIDDVVAEAERRDWIIGNDDRWSAGKESPS
jgi:hypothetical protein